MCRSGGKVLKIGGNDGLERQLIYMKKTAQFHLV